MQYFRCMWGASAFPLLSDWSIFLIASWRNCIPFCSAVDCLQNQAIYYNYLISWQGVGGGIPIQITKLYVLLKNGLTTLFVYVWVPIWVQIHNMILFWDGNTFVHIWVLKCEFTFLNFFLRCSIEHTRVIDSVLWSPQPLLALTSTQVLIPRTSFQQNFQTVL